METPRQKLVRLADELAKEKGLTLVLNETPKSQGYGTALWFHFQRPGEFEDAVKAVVCWGMSPAACGEAWAKIQEKLGGVTVDA
jgi:hypothetical protein